MQYWNSEKPGNIIISRHISLLRLEPKFWGAIVVKQFVRKVFRLSVRRYQGHGLFCVTWMYTKRHTILWN